MTKRVTLWGILTGLAVLALLSLAGCYTQVSTREDESGGYAQQQPDSAYDSTNTYAATGYDNGCCGDDEWYHPQVGFDYYYPSYLYPSWTFRAAFYDPFFYDPYWYGYYGYGYPYPYSYYGYYPPYYYGGGYYGGYNHGGHHGLYARNNTRNFGNTRGFGSGRGATEVRTDAPQAIDRGGYNLPVGGAYRSPATGSTGRTPTPAVSPSGGRTSAPAVTPSGRGNTGNRGVHQAPARPRSENRGGINRSGSYVPRNNGGNGRMPFGTPGVQGRRPAQQAAPAQRGHDSSSGQRRGAGPSMSAPPSHGAPSGGGHSGGGGGRSGGGGGRSGGGRGGRG